MPKFRTQIWAFTGLWTILVVWLIYYGSVDYFSRLQDANIPRLRSELSSPFAVNGFPHFSEENLGELYENAQFERRAYFSLLEEHFQRSKLCSKEPTLEEVMLISRKHQQFVQFPSKVPQYSERRTLYLCIGPAEIWELCNGIISIFGNKASLFRNPQNAKGINSVITSEEIEHIAVQCRPEPFKLPWYGGGPCMGLANEVLHNTPRPNRLRLVVIAGDGFLAWNNATSMDRVKVVTSTLNSMFLNIFPKFRDWVPILVWVGSALPEKGLYDLTPKVSSMDWSRIEEIDTLVNSAREDRIAVDKVNKLQEEAGLDYFGHVAFLPYLPHQLGYLGMRCDGLLYLSEHLPSGCKACFAPLLSFVQVLLNVAFVL